MAPAQILQVLFVLLFAPVLKGWTDKLKARAMGRVGPPVLQPYWNFFKFFCKERLLPVPASAMSEIVPTFYFLAPLLVSLLIPVLTNFPLPFAFLGDMLGGGMILGGASFLLLFLALDSGSPYSAIAASRMRFIAALAEPLTLVILFTAARVSGTTIPYVVNQSLVARPWYDPTHILIVTAWFLLLIAELGRLPVDNPDSPQELSLIDPNRLFEVAGPDLALVEWGGAMKFTVLGIVLVNVLATPFGLASSTAIGPLLGAMLITAAKLLLVGSVVALLETAVAKLRLLRIAEYLSYALSLAVVAALMAGVP
jgi:formate hydrogenlyase subunit 4